MKDGLLLTIPKRRATWGNTMIGICLKKKSSANHKYFVSYENRRMSINEKNLGHALLSIVQGR